jgi:AraC-like DNA-binding protein
MDDRLLALQMAAWMEKHLSDELSGQELATAAGYSENRLRQKFYNVTGETPAGYLRKRRLTAAARELMAGKQIVDVALSYGYSSQDNFTTAFKSWFGLNPGELRTMDERYRRFLARMKEPLNIMELANLKQSSLSTTLMGCMKGASDYYDLDWSVPKLFGYSGHAFLINVHAELCPSSPYVWNHDAFYLAMRGMGIRRIESVCLGKDAAPEAIKKTEERIKAHLDAGKICILDFLEHQLIAGYDHKGFLFLQPWQDCGGDSQIPALSFGDWGEALEREGWVQFTLIEKEESRPSEASLLPSALTGALRMRSESEAFEQPGYGIGDRAWENWIAGIDKGLGNSQGNRWTVTVWEECRSMAADFFDEIGTERKGASARRLCADPSSTYRACAARIGAVKEKDAEPEDRRKALVEGRELDREGARLMKELLAAIL